MEDYVWHTWYSKVDFLQFSFKSMSFTEVDDASVEIEASKVLVDPLELRRVYGDPRKYCSRRSRRIIDRAKALSALIWCCTACRGSKNFRFMKAQSLLSSQSEIWRALPIQRRHLGHLREESSSNLSKHSRHRIWLQRSRTGSFTISIHMGQSRSSSVSDSKSRAGLSSADRRA